jgi:hypothetical protein
MKYRIRSTICVLLAGLIVLTNSCGRKKEPSIRLITSKTISDFPSASAIEYDNNRLYIFGDDAPWLLILDTNYHQIDSIPFLNDTSYRITRKKKPDIESSALINVNDEKHLYALGSFSSKSRQNLFYFPLSPADSFLIIDISGFADKLKGIEEINIEGLAFTGTSFVMSNRANLSNRSNHLIISGNNLLNPNDAAPSIIKLLMDTNTVKGVSGLYYHLERDIMFFTASEEETTNAIEDGVINDSYLGWIKNFSDRIDEKEIQPDQLIRLSQVNKEFIKQKVESVCVQEIRRNDFILHLVSDNDKGQSKIFKISLRM